MPNRQKTPEPLCVKFGLIEAMSANANRPRQPRGVPAGGQWKAINRPESTAALRDEPAATIEWDSHGHFGGNHHCDHCGSAEVVAKIGEAYFCVSALAEALTGWA